MDIDHLDQLLENNNLSQNSKVLNWVCKRNNPELLLHLLNYKATPTRESF